MARTLENIVENHRVAAQRRAEGKPVWDKTLPIKHLLQQDTDNTSDEHAATVANQIAAVLRSRINPAWLDHSDDLADCELIEVVEGMEALRPDSYDDDEDFSPLEDLNSMLGQLYDWADKKRVWVS